MKKLANLAIVILMLAGTTLGSAVTITINQDAPTVLDFSIVWGSPVSEYGDHAVGQNGCNIYWLSQTTRNPNKYYVEIHDTAFSDLSGFWLTFNSDPEHTGPVDTSLTALGIGGSPHVLPLANTPYGARWVYGADDGGWTGLMFGMGMLGMCWVGKRAFV